MRPITTTSSLAPTASFTTQQNSSSWHSPIPYLFGGLAAMLGLIAFALLILACSYWKLSGQLQNEEENHRNNNRDLESNNEKEGDSINKESVKVYEDKILVIMAGDQNPTYLATPVCTKSSLNDAVGNHSMQNHETTYKSEDKEMDETYLQSQSQQEETQHQQQQ